MTDGTTHAVDSSDMAFRIAAAYAVREAMRAGQACILEPIMNLEVGREGGKEGGREGGREGGGWEVVEIAKRC